MAGYSHPKQHAQTDDHDHADPLIHPKRPRDHNQLVKSIKSIFPVAMSTAVPLRASVISAVRHPNGQSYMRLLW